jgi:hypothetical protein
MGDEMPPVEEESSIRKSSGNPFCRNLIRISCEGYSLKVFSCGIDPIHRKQNKLCYYYLKFCN